MRRYPTVRRMMNILEIGETQAKRVRGFMDGSLDVEESPAVVSWIRQCYHRPDLDSLKMFAINHALEGYGVEPIWKPAHLTSNGLDQLAAMYVNLGDTYVPTVLLSYMGDAPYGVFRLISWRDFVERLPRSWQE